MELINRYLHAVRFWLPKKQRDDIIAELSEEIRCQVEEREREAGRKLDDHELAGVLRPLGPPFAAANRYLPQRHLIGPVLFPIYLLVLRIVILICLVPHIVAWFVFVANPHGSWVAAASSSFGSLWMSVFFSVGIVTAIFAVIERTKANARPSGEWDPLKLPAVRDPLRIPPGSSIANLVFSAVLLALWAGSLGFQTVFQVAGVRITLAPSWRYFVGGFALIMLAHAALAVANLVRARWTRARAGVRLAIDFAGAVLFCWLLKAGVLQEVFVVAASKARTAGLVDVVYVGISNTFPFAVMVCALVVLVDVRRVFRAGPK
jgi:hypothetical protein